MSKNTAITMDLIIIDENYLFTLHKNLPLYKKPPEGEPVKLAWFGLLYYQKWHFFNIKNPL